MSLVCPIYNSPNACTQHKNCLFLRQGGCAIVLGATIAEKNKNILEDLEHRMNVMERNIRIIAEALGRR